MDRAARLGMLLLVGSLAAAVLIVATMLEREVVGPIAADGGYPGPVRSRRGVRTSWGGSRRP